MFSWDRFGSHIPMGLSLHFGPWVICLASLLTEFSVRALHSFHSFMTFYPPGFSADTCINVERHVAQEEEMSPTLCLLAVFWAWFVLAGLREGKSCHVSAECAVHVCTLCCQATLATTHPPAPLSCPACPWYLHQGENIHLMETLMLYKCSYS